MNSISETTRVVLLLCAYLGKEKNVKSLSQVEYGLLTDWLKKEGMTPLTLFAEKDVQKQVTSALGFNSARIEKLLSRGEELGLALEEWNSQHIWVLGRSDEGYPSRFRTHLGNNQAPPVIFGIGDSALLEKGGLGVVGSRNVKEKGTQLAQNVGRMCADNNYPVVSGFARGVDQLSMESSLARGGKAIGVLADSLINKGKLKRNAEPLYDGRLVLVSHRHPTSRFFVSAAMERNKFIYALSDCTLVVSSEYKKGGTWAGASEELKRQKPRPVFAWYGVDMPEGNKMLVEETGALKWEYDFFSSDLRSELAEQVEKKWKTRKTLQGSLIDYIEPPIDAESSINDEKNQSAKTAYEIIKSSLISELSVPNSSIELAKKFDVEKSQMTMWLKKGVDENIFVFDEKVQKYTTVGNSQP